MWHLGLFSLIEARSSSGFKPKALPIPRSSPGQSCVQRARPEAADRKAGRRPELTQHRAPHLAQLLMDELFQLRGLLRRQRHAGAGALPPLSPFQVSQKRSAAPSARPRASVAEEHNASATGRLAPLAGGVTLGQARRCAGAELQWRQRPTVFSNGGGQPGPGAAPACLIFFPACRSPSVKLSTPRPQHTPAPRLPGSPDALPSPLPLHSASLSALQTGR